MYTITKVVIYTDWAWGAMYTSFDTGQTPRPHSNLWMRLDLTVSPCPIFQRTLDAVNPMTCRPSSDVARDSATYAWPFSNTLLRSTLTLSSAANQPLPRHLPIVDNSLCPCDLWMDSAHARMSGT